MFVEVAALVEQQGEMVDRIENNVMQAEVDVEKGNGYTPTKCLKLLYKILLLNHPQTQTQLTCVQTWIFIPLIFQAATTLNPPRS